MKFKSKKEIELYIVENYKGQISKSNIKEPIYNQVDGSEVIHNLWLYYEGTIHIGTWDATAKKGWTFSKAHEDGMPG